ncbi:transposase [Streptomyces avermitilis]|uniref:transposase n=1 Tax=Streptomyces avermitilis TaxID=33903 RepID=UPI003687E7E1
MSRSEDAVGDSDGRRERDGGTLSGQRGSFEREDLGRLLRSTRSPVAMNRASPKTLDAVDNRGPALTPWSWKYPDELRERALREVQTSGRPVAHVAKDLGIHKEALRG